MLHDMLQVYHAFYKPLEYYLPERDAQHCYIKVGGENVWMNLNLSHSIYQPDLFIVNFDTCVRTSS